MTDANPLINVVSELNKVLDESINPQLALHNGSCEVTAFDKDGVAWVKFYGACASCVSQDDTFQFTVKETLMKVDPQVKDVKIDESVSEDILSIARKILNGEKP